MVTPPIQPALPLTKIVATLGPATDARVSIARLLEAGVSVVRLNFSHGTLDRHLEVLQTVRDVAKERGVPTAVMGDLQGPKIRLRTGRREAIDVPTGARIIIARTEATEQAIGEFRFTCTDASIIDDVRPGQRLLIDDGRVRCLVFAQEDGELIATVTQGGEVKHGKGINLPDSDLSLATLTDRDREHVRWSVENGLDFLALSFVRSAADIATLAALIDEIQDDVDQDAYAIPIIAKIEVPQAVAQIDSIVDIADAIMVARGDLGVELDLAEVPVIQKRLIATAQAYGKPCIVATQMLESMITMPTPTRAEASDVAGAIFDQVDAVMLSGETAVGRYPAMAVEHMRRIAEHTEAALARVRAVPSPPARLVESRYRTAALAHGVWTVARDIDAVCIVVWSQEGGGARYLSQNNFHIPIVAVTSDERAARRMQLYRGVTPVTWPVPDGLSEFTGDVDAFLQASRRAEPGDSVILVAGEPLGLAGVTNSQAGHVIGDPDTGYAHHR